MAIKLSRPEPKAREPGTVRQDRIPVYDHKLRQRGHVTPHATAATVARFVGQHGAKLTKVEGRLAWVGPKPPTPKPLPAPAPQPKIVISGKSEPSPDKKAARGSAKPRSKESN